MPEWLMWVMLILIILLIGACIYLLQMVQRIENYIGTNVGPPAGWTGLSKWTRQTTADLGHMLDDLRCRVFMLEFDYPPRSPKPSPCPPGPPGTVPKGDPSYPP